MAKTLAALLATLLLWPVPTLHASAQPRAVAGSVADAIEQRYFDPQRARAIADGLRTEAARGDFDRLDDPRDLATALTARLKPLDRHFMVRWSPAAKGSADAAPRRRAAPDPGDNYGIRRVEVLPGNLGYLDLRSFAHFESGDPQAPARQSIDAALRLLANADALIVDLRDNGGGSPAMVGYLASAFVAPGADIYNTFHSRRGTRSEAPVQTYPAPRTQLPLYVLTSGRTGSAAESFAYTLKHAGRATVIGEASGGAANPGGPVEVGDGFSVFVSTGSPVNPKTGGNWEETGVAPDVPVAAADALAVAQRQALAALVGNGAGTAARWALEALAPAPGPLAVAPLADYAGDYGALRIVTAEGALELHQGRRPPLRLRPVSADLFFVEGEPTRRVRFDRDGAGAVATLELLLADGDAMRHRRGTQ